MPKFMVTHRIQGTATEIIEADSADEIEAKLDAMDMDEAPDLDHVDDWDSDVHEMHEVTHDGRTFWTTNPRAYAKPAA